MFDGDVLEEYGSLHFRQEDPDKGVVRVNGGGEVAGLWRLWGRHSMCFRSLGEGAECRLDGRTCLRSVLLVRCWCGFGDGLMEVVLPGCICGF